jgi:hypothetical protein
MKRHDVALIAAGVLGVGSITACDHARAGNRSALRAEYDTLAARLEQTNRALAALIRMDTTPVPKCPPKCRELAILRAFVLAAPPEQTNRTVAALIAVVDTTPPPKCPPYCSEMEILRAFGSGRR